MSIEAMKWAMEQTIVERPADRHVLLVMANNARDDGTAAFPSVSTIADKTGLSERTVQYAIKRLLDDGAIKKGSQSVVAAHISRSDQRPNNYDLALSRGATDDKKRGAPAAPRAERGATDDINGVQLTTERGAPVAPEPSSNPTKEPSKRKEARDARTTPAKESAAKKSPAPKIVKPDGVDSDTWADWLALRKQKRATVTNTVIKSARKEAEKAGMSLEDFFSEWCLRGSQGLKAEWITGNRGSTPRNSKQLEA